ncbi:MAG: hypothetical protein Q9209_001216 [Squamulea sp. 1 TL-2023]
MSVPSEDPITSDTAPSTNDSVLTDKSGWDGKLRVEKRAEVVNADTLSDPDYSDEDAPPVEQIQADEDLLEDYEEDTDEIDLVHSRISSIPALHLARFPSIEVCTVWRRAQPDIDGDLGQKLCLRQNQISHIEFPSNIGQSLQELDLYDNLISHIRGLDHLLHLTSLDLSFNKIKHVKNVNHLKELKDIYFVQNRIQKIENLEGLERLRNLELAANRIREIENLDSLTGLEELWLGKNKITELKNVSSLANLKILSIQSNRLPAITGLDALVNLEELYISHNALTHISGLEHNRRLRVVDISSNQISQLANLEHLDQLEELWASSNQFSSFDEVEKELAGKKQLSTVYFEANPLQAKNPALYRNKIRLVLPQIKQIDAMEVAAGLQRLHTEAPGVAADGVYGKREKKEEWGASAAEEVRQIFGSPSIG